MLITIVRVQKYTFMGRGGVGGGGWLDQVGIRLTQVSTGLKVEAELGNRNQTSQCGLVTFSSPTLFVKTDFSKKREQEEDL